MIFHVLECSVFGCKIGQNQAIQPRWRLQLESGFPDDAEGWRAL
jgi:hypothetical protein